MRKFTEEESAFIVANACKYGCTQMAKELTSTFGVKRSHQAVSRHCKDVLKIVLTNSKRHQYTEKECNFLRANIEDNSYNELRKMFNKQFGLKKTTRAIEHKCRKLGLNHGHEGVKFIKGENNPFSPTLPIGSETISAGKVYVKVANSPISSGNSRLSDNGNWMQKNRYVYEQAHGKIPDGQLLIALDGNKNNFNPDNFYAVPRHINMMLSANKWHSTDREKTLAAIKWCELFYAMKDGLQKDGR